MDSAHGFNSLLIYIFLPHPNRSWHTHTHIRGNHLHRTRYSLEIPWNVIWFGRRMHQIKIECFQIKVGRTHYRYKKVSFVPDISYLMRRSHGHNAQPEPKPKRIRVTNSNSIPIRMKWDCVVTNDKAMKFSSRFVCSETVSVCRVPCADCCVCVRASLCRRGAFSRKEFYL